MAAKDRKGTLARPARPGEGGTGIDKYAPGSTWCGRDPLTRSINRRHVDARTLTTEVAWREECIVPRVHSTTIIVWRMANHDGASLCVW